MECELAHATFDTIINESRFFGSPLYILLIDTKGAFDNISYAFALSALIEFKVSFLRLDFLDRVIGGLD